MPRVVIDKTEKVSVYFSTESEKQEARVWLWNYLKTKDHISTIIKHEPNGITAEIVDIEKKEF